MLRIVDEDEMCETLDTLPFDPFSPFHVIRGGFSSPFCGGGVLKDGTIAACELESVLLCKELPKPSYHEECQTFHDLAVCQDDYQ